MEVAAGEGLGLGVGGGVGGAAVVVVVVVVVDVVVVVVVDVVVGGRLVGLGRGLGLTWLDGLGLVTNMGSFVVAQRIMLLLAGSDKLARIVLLTKW